MYLDGRLNKEEIKVIWMSPPYANYVWAVQPGINKQQRILIRDAFMQMNQNSDGKSLLKNLGASYYIPTGHHEFSRLEQVITHLGPQEVVQ